MTLTWLLHNWGLEAMTTFMDLLYSAKIKRGVEDQICWQLTKSGLFVLMSFYSVLSAEDVQSFP